MRAHPFRIPHPASLGLYCEPPVIAYNIQHGHYFQPSFINHCCLRILLIRLADACLSASIYRAMTICTDLSQGSRNRVPISTKIITRFPRAAQIAVYHQLTTKLVRRHLAFNSVFEIFSFSDQFMTLVRCLHCSQSRVNTTSGRRLASQYHIVTDVLAMSLIPPSASSCLEVLHSLL